MSAVDAGGPVIRVRGLRNQFGAQVVHENLDLDVRRGEILGVVGGSGSGKSVLMRSIIGLRQPDAGEVEVLGINALEASDAQNFAESLAAYSLGQWKDPAWRVETLAFGTDLVIGSTNVLSLELGNVVDVTEAQTATSGQRALVVGALYSLRDGEARATLRVRRMDTQTYWRLDDATYSVLGSTTRLTI